MIDALSAAIVGLFEVVREKPTIRANCAPIVATQFGVNPTAGLLSVQPHCTSYPRLL